jgi:hypothetical protein
MLALAMIQDDPRTFEEFWPYYVSQHMNPTCRTLHAVGTSIGLLHLPAVAIFPPLVVPALAWGYGMAWIGHFAFEKNKPATWNSPQHALWSLRGDFRMLRKMLAGTMDAEVERVRGMLEPEGQPARAPADAPSSGIHA